MDKAKVFKEFLSMYRLDKQSKRICMLVLLFFLCVGNRAYAQETESHKKPVPEVTTKITTSGKEMKSNQLTHDTLEQAEQIEFRPKQLIKEPNDVHQTQMMPKMNPSKHPLLPKILSNVETEIVEVSSSICQTYKSVKDRIETIRRIKLFENKAIATESQHQNNPKQVKTNITYGLIPSNWERAVRRYVTESETINLTNNAKSRNIEICVVFCAVLKQTKWISRTTTMV